MVSCRLKSKSIRSTEQSNLRSMLSNSNELIGVKTSRVYSQIARMGRNPGKQTERAILIDALERAILITTINGRDIKKDPPYITLTAQDVERCFGRQLEKLPGSSFFLLSERA